MELIFCKRDVYLLDRRKQCMMATYNFGSVYMYADNITNSIAHKSAQNAQIKHSENNVYQEKAVELKKN